MEAQVRMQHKLVTQIIREKHIFKVSQVPFQVSVVGLLNAAAAPSLVAKSLTPIVQFKEVIGCEFLPYISLLVPCKELYFLYNGSPLFAW